MSTTTSSQIHNLPPVNFDPDFASVSELACYYRECKLQVVPAWMPGEPKDGASWKRPFLKTWTRLQNELVEITTFRSWYDPVKGTYSTRQNLGLITGRCSWRVFVIDLDTQKNPKALEWWRGILAKHNSRIEPETCEQITGGGGLQLLFRAPVGAIIPTCKTSVGVDIRGEGGFAMLPSSLHESGQHYAWKPGRAPWECEIALAPGWLVDEVKKLASEHRAASAGHPGNAGASKGNGHTAAGEPQLDAFHHVVDGREEVMRDMVWHAVLEWRRECPILPPESQWLERARAAYEAYEARVSVQDRSSKLSKREQLDVEGRGTQEWWRKWRAAMLQWGEADFEAEAAKPPPKGDGGGDQADPDFEAGPQAAPAPAPMAPSSIPLIWPFPITEARLPVRGWSVPGLLLRRALTLLAAPPGTGKSLFTIQLSIAVALGMEWAGWTVRRAEKVLLINCEDDLDEMQRRLVAAARHMGVDQSRLEGRIALANREGLVIATFDGRTRTVIRTPLIEDLVKTIEEHGFGLVIVDPFAETHSVDENNNSQIKWAGILWRELVRRTSICGLIVHHTRKGSNEMAGEADAFRGGGSMIGIGRVICTLMTMTEEEAKALEIPPDERRDYVRFDDAKVNYSRAETKRWFKKVTIQLGNATAFVPGDEVGVLDPWVPAGALDGRSIGDINAVLEMIDRGMHDDKGNPTGHRYTASPRSKDRWVGNLLMEHFGCSEAAAKATVKRWLEEGVLEEVEYPDPRRRTMMKGLRAPQQNRPGSSQKFT